MKKIMILIAMTGFLAQANAADIGYSCKGKTKAFTVEVSENGESTKMSWQSLDDRKWVDVEDSHKKLKTFINSNGGLTIFSSFTPSIPCSTSASGIRICAAVMPYTSARIINVWGRGASSIQGNIGYSGPVDGRWESVRFDGNTDTEIYNCYRTK